MLILPRRHGAPTLSDVPLTLLKDMKVTSLSSGFFACLVGGDHRPRR